MCPQQFLFSPFVLYAKLDPSRMDGLTFTQNPLQALQGIPVPQPQTAFPQFPMAVQFPYPMPLPNLQTSQLTVAAAPQREPPPPPGPPPTTSHSVPSAASTYRRAL